MWRYVLHSLYRCKTNGQIKITLFVGFGLSDDRGLVVLIVLVVLVVPLVVPLVVLVVLVVPLVVPLVVLVIFVTIVVGVSRRPRIVSDGDEAPVDQPGDNFLGDAWGHVSSCLDVATFAPNPTGTQASTVMSTALRRSNVAVSNLRSNSRARRHESLSSICVGGRAISAYLSRYLALSGSQKLSG